MNTPKDTKPLVTKAPQEIIHIKHTISARQYKYWFLLLKTYKELWEAGAEKDEKGFYNVSIAEISNLIGYELVKKELKADLEALRQQPIIINYLEKNGKPVTHGMGFVSEWKVSSTQIAFKLPSFLEDVLKGDLQAKQMFLLLNWDIFNSFNGKYEAIIYKLCKDYIGVGRTPYMSIERYREYIGLKDNEYKATDNLTRRCITNPIQNINNSEISDILIDVELKRSGRKVLGLNFTMKYKPQIQQIVQIEHNEPNPAFEKSLIPINPQKQIEYLTRYSEEQIKAIINYVNAQNEQKEIKNLGGYYAKAFENGWGLDNWEAEQKAKAEAEEKKRQAKAEREAKKQAEKEAKEREEQEKAERERCFAVFEALPIEEQEAILDEVEAETMPFMANLFKKDRKNGLKPYRKPPHYFALIRIMQAKNL